ncbi:MAG: cysteine synthase A [Candidatus Thermoplasmatota archaeon]
MVKGGDIFAQNLLDTIGNTPLIKVNGIYAKLETTNPTGSIKDRVAWYMIKKAERNEELDKNTTIVEATSGNTGISFSMISAIKDYKFMAFMPRCMSPQRRKMMELFGAEVILTPAEENMDGVVKRYEKYVNNRKNLWLPRQFKNNDNVEAHRKTTGPEIINQTHGKIDAIVAGVGTGGTLIGIAKALKENNLKTEIIAVEPEESPLLSKGKVGEHNIQGIGEDFIPKIIEENIDLIDRIITVKSKKAIQKSRILAKKHGLLVGISSGANITAAENIKSEYRNVLTILPDRGERYLSVL